jgi:putative ABC transport system substrate-binding protein
MKVADIFFSEDNNDVLVKNNPLKTLAFILLAWVGLFVPPVAKAQSPEAMPRIGWLSAGSPATHGSFLDAFRLGLREHGYVEGKNIRIEYRWADGYLERLPTLAHELVQLKVNIIVTASTPATRATQAATKTIPIVTAVTGGDPVAAGFVASLAHPGGNITGLSTLAQDLTPKSLELLHAAVPKATRIAVLLNPANAWYETFWADSQAAARILGLALVRVEVRTPKDIEGAFRAIAEARADAFIVFADPMYVAQRNQIVALAEKNHLPGMYPFREFVQAGGLISYGVSLPDNYRRAATYVDKILKGAKPADLPLEQPTKFELVINTKTAKRLGLKIPPALTVFAEELIQQ